MQFQVFSPLQSGLMQGFIRKQTPGVFLLSCTFSFLRGGKTRPWCHPGLPDKSLLLEFQQAFPSPWSVGVCDTAWQRAGLQAAEQGSGGTGAWSKGQQNCWTSQHDRNRDLGSTSAADHSLIKQCVRLQPLSHSVNTSVSIDMWRTEAARLLGLKAWDPESHLNLSRDAFPACLRIFYFSWFQLPI